MITQTDWRQLHESTPGLPTGSHVTVIVPAHCRQEMLDHCLTALVHQDLDHSAFDVVVIDHRSPVPLSLPDVALDVTLHRLDEGYGPGAARAFGADRAKGDVLVFIDVDILAYPSMLREYATLPANQPSVLTLGFRDFVDPDKTDAESIRGAITSGDLESFAASRLAPEGQEWIDNYVAKHDHASSWRDDLWVIVVGAGIGLSRRLYELSGGFRDFDVHGVEDTEFGWRAYQAGAVIAPNPEARGVHLGLRSISRDRESINRQRAGHMANLIPHPRYRVMQSGQLWEVPRVLAQVPVDGDVAADALIATCQDLLGGRDPDLRVELVVGENVVLSSEVVSWLAADPRVSFVSAPARIPQGVPYVLRALPGVRLGRQSVPKIIRELASGAGLACVVAGSDSVSLELFRTSALVGAQFFSDLAPREAMRQGYGEVWLAGSKVEVSHPAPQATELASPQR